MASTPRPNANLFEINLLIIPKKLLVSDIA